MTRNNSLTRKRNFFMFYNIYKLKGSYRYDDYRNSSYKKVIKIKCAYNSL